MPAPSANLLRKHGDRIFAHYDQRALDYQRLLRKQIVKVEIVCAERDADVSLDGKRLFTGPGRVTTMVIPGTHEIVASKPKYITSREAFTAKAAEHVRIEFRLIAKHRTPDTPHAEQ